MTGELARIAILAELDTWGTIARPGRAIAKAVGLTQNAAHNHLVAMESSGTVERVAPACRVARSHARLMLWRRTQ